MTCFYFLGKHITLNCRRDTMTIFQPIWNSIRICGLRLDYLVDPIEIEFTVSSILQLMICEWVVVYWSLVPCNWVQANNLWSSKWLYENKFKLRRLDLVLRRPNLYMRWLVWAIKWISSNNCWQSLLVQVANLVTLLVSIKVCLLLLL